MTQEKLIDAITDLDSDILNRYFDMKADLAAKKKPKKRAWVKWASVAACFCIVVMSAILIPNILDRADVPNVNPGGDFGNENPGGCSPADYFQIQKNDDGVIVFSVVAGLPQAKYTYKDDATDENVSIALNNANGEINSLLFDLLNGRSTIADDESDAFTDCISMTYSYSYDGHSKITVIYEFKWSSASNTMTIFKNNTLVGTVLLSDDEMSDFKDALANASKYTDPDSNSGKRLPIVMTIAETLPSCVTFEYKDGNLYCFYAYDDDGKLYRVLWNNLDGLNEKDRIVVDHNGNIVVLNYDEYPSGWTPQYEITAISIYSEEEWNAFEENRSNGN